jgi:hypothetical protein
LGGGFGTPPAELLELVSQTSPDKELEHNTQVVKVVPPSILYDALIPQWVFGYHNRHPDLYSRVYPGRGLSFRLAGKSIENGSRPKVQGFVYQKDNWEIFCGASPEVRRKVVIDEAKKEVTTIKIAQSGSAEVAKLIRRHLEASLMEILSCVDKKPLCPSPGEAPSKHQEFLASVGLMMPMDQSMFEMMISVKNRVWLEHIERSSSAHRRTFVVVGSMHLPSFGTPGRTNPGMLDLLREHGYTVSPVRRYEDLAPYLNGSNQSLAKRHID